MEPRAVMTVPALPMREANIDTDRILPSRFMQKPRSDGFGDYFFHNQRHNPAGEKRPDFVANDPAYRNARLLLAGENFGCGSSREQAVYAILDFGIRAVIAPSFGDIFHSNALQNGLLAIVLPSDEVDTLLSVCEAAPTTDFTIDLDAQTVTTPRTASMSFRLDGFHKKLLLSGQDEIAYTFGFMGDIERFESARRHTQAWL